VQLPAEDECPMINSLHIREYSTRTDRACKINIACLSPKLEESLKSASKPFALGSHIRASATVAPSLSQVQPDSCRRWRDRLGTIMDKLRAGLGKCRTWRLAARCSVCAAWHLKTELMNLAVDEWVCSDACLVAHEARRGLARQP